MTPFLISLAAVVVAPLAIIAGMVWLSQPRTQDKQQRQVAGSGEGKRSVHNGDNA